MTNDEWKRGDLHSGAAGMASPLMKALTRAICHSSFLLLALLLCSCATFARREGVQVNLVNLAPGESTVLETAMNFTIRIQNELPEPVVLNGAVHKIYLNGTYVGEGLSNERLEIPRLSTATQNVTVHLRNVTMLTKLRGIIEAQAVDYKMTSVLYTESQGRYRAVRESRLDLKDFQPPRATP